MLCISMAMDRRVAWRLVVIRSILILLISSSGNLRRSAGCWVLVEICICMRVIWPPVPKGVAWLIGFLA